MMVVYYTESFGIILALIVTLQTSIYTVIFDGYGNGPSIKDHEHIRKTKTCSPDVDVKKYNPGYKNQTAFLMTANNKQAFVLLLFNV